MVKELEQQPSDYKTMVAELAKDDRALKNPIKKALAPTGKRKAVYYLISEEHPSMRVTCEAIGLAGSTYYEKPAGLKE